MRIWLAMLLILVSGAIVLGANLALVGYGQPHNDPVGQLTPASLRKSEATLGPAAQPSPALSPSPRLHERVVSGRENDD